nr:FtsQ-type POTRA domain-containing protein [Actinomycetota bacterium]NIS36949.1 FtsQ-type POTRA domain-containing protein [Actinomycetota bacterium]NIT98463.1 FtsQ-type POTRA domain-containing protein [Actinomycetota bacterium]NIU22072.1 FtsQ-type POTRA domain-containing protein [Actinomycetota bacterium]NIU70566.1 FtsQ-type POTRA domain-containing protein [Actinomycetota bacterium]
MTLTIGIDPRIRARRIAVRRAEGRRRLRFLLAALAVVGIAVGAWALSRSPLLDLDHVRIEGVGAGRVAAVDAAAGLGRGTPLVDVDLGAVETAVEALPWVRVAEASRDWPGTVRIDVGERVPVA